MLSSESDDNIVVLRENAKKKLKDRNISKK